MALPGKKFFCLNFAKLKQFMRIDVFKCGQNILLSLKIASTFKKDSNVFTVVALVVVVVVVVAAAVVLVVAKLTNCLSSITQ